MSELPAIEQPMRSVHTSNLPEILEQLGISVLVSTYQAGRLVVLRSENGVLNTHFRMFDKPMGLAVQPNRFAIGTAMQVGEFHNVPAVFGGVPIAEQALTERNCGVWVVNIDSGQLVGFVKFEDAVQEIFAVELLSGTAYPEVVNEDRELLARTYELPENCHRSNDYGRRVHD